MKHILLKYLVEFTRNRLDNPEGFKYDSTEGMWVDELDVQHVLVKSVGPGKPIRGTKKNDVETGEDMKGQ